MKKVKVLFVTLLVLVCFSATAMAKHGPTKFSTMTRVETHTKIGKKITGNTYNYSGETFGYQMISASRVLQEGYIGSIFYLLRFNFDDDEVASHIGGINLTRVFNPNWIFNLGYSHSTSPEQYIVGPVEKVDSDRFAFTLIYNVNPKEKKGPKYSLTTGFSTVTDFGESQVISEKVAMKFPIWREKWSGEVAYTYNYSTQQDEQLTNQFNGRVFYQINKKSKLTLGVLYIDNVYTNNQGDDTVTRLSYNVNLR
ncbi:MAG: hypothetical protein ABIH66_04290 [bacterium]